MSEKRFVFEGPNGVAKRVILCDENGDPYIASGGGGGGGAANDREFVVTTYRATSAGTGYSVGDTITLVQVLDVDGDAITVVGTPIWHNQTTGLALAGAPTSSHLALTGGNPLTDAQLRASAVAVAPQSTGRRNVATITRAANTTAYAVGDVVGGVLTFSSIAASGDTITIMGADILWNLGALPAGMSAYTLHLYSATPPSAYADNAAWDLPSGDRSAYIGSVAITAPVDLGSTLFASNDDLRKVVALAPSSTAIYAYLVTTTAYTPAANSETGEIRLRLYAGL